MGILLVYDITVAKTFDNITRWLSNIDAHAASDVQKLLLGNKSDLDSKRAVQMDDGQRLADSQGIPFLETSAKSNVNIDEAFMTMAKLILEKNPKVSQGSTLKPANHSEENPPSKDKECCKS